jgi:hypothetical protein
MTPQPEDRKKISSIHKLLGVVFAFLSIIFIVILTQYLEFEDAGPRFTYEDGVALYTICSKNERDREDIKEGYQGNETDFSRFLENQQN